MSAKLGTGWRNAVAQAVLWALYGRRWHYITPYKAAGVASSLLIYCDGKVLLGKRRGAIEHPGLWSGLGGFVNLRAHESFAQAAAREVFEESGLVADPAQFGDQPGAIFLAGHKTTHDETDYTAVVGYYYARVAKPSFIGKLEPQEETEAFAWFDEKACRRMVAAQEIPPDFTDLHDALLEGFRRLKAGEAFPLLKVK